MFVTGTTDTDIIIIVKQLKTIGGIGNDGILCHIVKSTIGEIAAPLEWLLTSHLKLVIVPKN